MVIKAKILISYHKEDMLIKNSILTPIHVGRDLNTSSWLEENMIGDNTGDNISSKNNRYCELTAQYFAWKNLEKLNNPEYIGFLHYRRLLNFNSLTEYPTNKDGQIEFPFVNDKLYELFGLSEEDLIKEIQQYDVLTVKPFDVQTTRSTNNYKQYADCHNIRDYDLAIKCLIEKYPDFKKAIEIYNNSNMAYFTNCFVMKISLFKEYAEWLFSILFEIESDIKFYKDNYQNRVMGFLSERLFGIYLTHLKLSGKIKIKELQPVFLLSTKKVNYIPIVFSCNNNYTLHLCCALTSILENSKEDSYFVFYVLNTKKNLNYVNKKLLSKFNTPKSMLKFVSIDQNAFLHLPQTVWCSHITIETYYRFLLESSFWFLDKIIYLDCDINVLSDLNELYSIDIEDYYIAGVEDILSEESKQRLELLKYINAGVLLVNLKKWRENNVKQKLFDYAINNADKIVWQDQDVLNVVLQDGIKYISPIWNAQVGEYQHCYQSGFNDIGKNANIIHHIGCNKPWKPGCKSPFIETYYKYLNLTGWECKIVKYSLYRWKLNIIFFFQLLKKMRHKIIWYDSRNENLVVLSHYNYKIKCNKKGNFE